MHIPNHSDVPYRARMENAIRRFFPFTMVDVQISRSVGRWRGLNARETNKICAQENGMLFEDRWHYSSALIEENTPGPCLCLQNTRPEGHGLGKIENDEGNSAWDWIASSKIFSLSICRFGISLIFNYVYQKLFCMSIQMCLYLCASVYTPSFICIPLKNRFSHLSHSRCWQTQHYPCRMQISSSLELNDASAE